MGCMESFFLNSFFVFVFYFFIFIFWLFLKIIYFNWWIITWQYHDDFLLYINMNQPQVCVPHPETRSHIPPHLIPLGCPRALASGCLFHASHLHWWSNLHMVMYMFQRYSHKSSHPCLLSWSQKSVLYICLLCRPACRMLMRKADENKILICL